MDEARLDAMAEIGVTRASLGIQDFDPKVQAAINREQSFEATKLAVDGLRARDIDAINVFPFANNRLSTAGLCVA